MSFTALYIALICSGVVPQQPPQIFKSPFWASSRYPSAIISGVCSYSPKALGNPAFAYKLILNLVYVPNSSI